MGILFNQALYLNMLLLAQYLHLLFQVSKEFFHLMNKLDIFFVNYLNIFMFEIHIQIQKFVYYKLVFMIIFQ